MAATAFVLELGPERPSGGEFRSPKDKTQEILVNFDDGRELSLGWITSFHEIGGCKLQGVALIDQVGDALPGLATMWPSKAKALDAAQEFLARWITINSLTWDEIEEE